jgi:glycerol uptake facilitator-like aquaporin
LSEAASLPHRVVSELRGPAFLLATVVGSGIMAEPLAGGNAAIVLPGNTIPTGASLVVLFMVVGPVSGAQSTRLPPSAER